MSSIELSNLLKWDTWGLFNSNQFYNYRMFIAKEVNQVPKINFLDNLEKHPVIPEFNLGLSLRLTESICQSDFVLVPHDWIYIKRNREYVIYLNSLSKSTPILIINTGDISPEVNINNSLELRTFLHPWEKLNRKIVIPYSVRERKFTLRPWKPFPTISFMGYVPKLGIRSFFGTNIRGLAHPIQSSVYLNRKLSIRRLKSLKHKFTVNTEIRKQFTAYKSNPDLNLHMKQFQESLSNSDYVLCPRGAGNSSIRFYESLSSGATPVLIDTRSELPIISEKEFWSSNILSCGLFENWERLIINDWANLEKDHNYISRQIKNRDIFLNELRIEKYLPKLFRNYHK